jgi:hypothetical protein
LRAHDLSQHHQHKSNLGDLRRAGCDRAHAAAPRARVPATPGAPPAAECKSTSEREISAGPRRRPRPATTSADFRGSLRCLPSSRPLCARSPCTCAAAEDGRHESNVRCWRGRSGRVRRVLRGAMMPQTRAESGARSAPPRIRCFPLLRRVAGKHLEVQKRRRREVWIARPNTHVGALRTS